MQYNNYCAASCGEIYKDFFYSTVPVILKSDKCAWFLSFANNEREIKKMAVIKYSKMYLFVFFTTNSIQALYSAGICSVNL